MPASAETDAVRLDRAGVWVDGARAPLLAGSVHYFRLPRDAWEPALRAIKSMGARFVDTYVPWALHEHAQGAFDFGEESPRLDVVAFLKLAHSLGLGAIVRPGPHINAELTGFGIPERVLWNEACQARSPSGAPVVLPILPRAFPVPSYASRAFFDEAALWLAAVAERLAPLRAPDGPIALVQIDNEGALYFRDGPFDQDYHPDAIGQFRRFLAARYEKGTRLRAAYADDSLTFDTVEPPRELSARWDATTLTRCLDWLEFQESMIGAALYRFRGVLARNGLSGLPTFHNLPMAESATPLDPGTLERSVSFVAADYYHGATEAARTAIARRTSELAFRGGARDVPTYCAEAAAGQAPYFPPQTETDNAFNVLTAMAYGLRGFNVYMAVGRDRWIGGPFDEAGRPRDEARFWTRLCAAVERTRFEELVRSTPVRVVVPRVLRRLVRGVHAWDALSPALFALGDDGSRASTLEVSPWPEGPTVPEVLSFLEDLTGALDTAGLAFSILTEDLLSEALTPDSWTICVCPGSLPRPTTETLSQAIMGRLAVSIGPELPERDERGIPCPARLLVPDNARVRVHLPTGSTALTACVEAIARELGLRRLVVDPPSLHATVHEDATGRPRMLFLVNPHPEGFAATLDSLGAQSARDALSGEIVERRGERFVLDAPPRTTRMLELFVP